MPTNGYVSGGVGAAYDYNTDSRRVWQAWTADGCALGNPDNCQIFLQSIPNP